MTKRSIARTANEYADIALKAAPLLLIAFLVDAAFIFVYLVVLQSYLPESLHASASIGGAALASFGVAKLLTQMAGGIASDRLGVKRAMIFGIAASLSADLSVLGVANVAPWFVLAAAALAGVGSSLTWPAVYAAGYARFVQTEKARFSALLTLSTGCALLAGLGAGGILDDFISFNVAMVVPIAALVLALFITFIAHSSADTEELKRQTSQPTPGEFRTLLAEPRRVAFAALILIEAMAIGALTATFRAYGRDLLEVSLTTQELLLLPAAIAGALLVMPGGALADRFGPTKVMAAGFATAGTCLFVLSQVTDASFVVVLATLAGAGFALAVPGIAATMMHMAGEAVGSGGVIGWFMTMDGIGHAAGPAIAGALLALAGVSSVLILAGLLFAAVAALALPLHLADRAHPLTIRADSHERDLATSRELIGGRS